MKRLGKSRTNKVISGVCGGIGEYFNVDPSIVRIIWVVGSIFSAGWLGLILYIVCACVLPENQADDFPPSEYKNDSL